MHRGLVEELTRAAPFRPDASAAPPFFVSAVSAGRLLACVRTRPPCLLDAGASLPHWLLVSQAAQECPSLLDDVIDIGLEDVFACMDEGWER